MAEGLSWIIVACKHQQGQPWLQSGFVWCLLPCSFPPLSFPKYGFPWQGAMTPQSSVTTPRYPWSCPIRWRMQGPLQESQSSLFYSSSHTSPPLSSKPLCSSFLYFFVIDYPAKKQYGKERNLFHFIILYYNPTLRESEGRNFTSYPHVKAGRNKSICTHLPGLSSISPPLNSLGPSAKRMEPPMLCWVFLTIEAVPPRHAQKTPTQCRQSHVETLLGVSSWHN